MITAAIIVAAVVCLAACIVIGLAVEPAWIVSLGLAASIFSGHWNLIGVPVGIDRLIIVGGLAAAVLQCIRARTRVLDLRPVHIVMLALVAYTVGSAYFAHTLTRHDDFYALLDKLGIVPFLLFALAPVVFRTSEQRSILIKVLVATGLYLGVIGTLETVGAQAALLPRYIANSNIGIHANRARGPFLESAANGQALFACLVAAVVAASRWRSRRARTICAAVGGMCLIGIVGTVTRQIWIAAALASLAAVVSSASLRRFLIPGVIVSVLGVSTLLLADPALTQRAQKRADAEKPVWDRYNSNRAAYNMALERPLLGYGWGRYPDVSNSFYQLAPNYPLSTISVVHNIFLSDAAELGVIGVMLFLAAIALALAPLATRVHNREQETWRTAAIANAICWLFVVNFAPFGYAFANYSFWLLMGVAAGVLVPARSAVAPSARSMLRARWETAGSSIVARGVGRSAATSSHDSGPVA